MLTNVKAEDQDVLKSFVLEAGGFGGRGPSRQRLMEVRGLGDFTVFFKKYAFLGIVWSKSCVFKWLNEVMMRL